MTKKMLDAQQAKYADNEEIKYVQDVEEINAEKINPLPYLNDSLEKILRGVETRVNATNNNSLYNTCKQAATKTVKPNEGIMDKFLRDGLAIALFYVISSSIEENSIMDHKDNKGGK